MGHFEKVQRISGEYFALTGRPVFTMTAEEYRIFCEMAESHVFCEESSEVLNTSVRQDEKGKGMGTPRVDTVGMPTAGIIYGTEEYSGEPSGIAGAEIMDALNLVEDISADLHGGNITKAGTDTDVGADVLAMLRAIPG